MTARRLRRENKPDVKRFLYVPLPIATVSFVGSASTRVAVERRDPPHIVVNLRNVATCRSLSQSVVISRNALKALWARDAKKVEFYRPETPSPFPL
jgi:hypothetical protein